jgi:type VI secretion system secreted protein Hcp
MFYPQIDGDVTTKGWEKWIALDQCTFSNGRGLSMTVGAGSDREKGHLQVSDVSVSKQYDAASQKLFRESLSGTGQEVKIHFTQSKEGAETQQSYLEVTLTNTLISSWSTGAGGGTKPQESLSLSYTKIGYRQIKYDANNKPVNPVTTTFDVATGVTS